MARSKRDHASGINSTSFGLTNLAMTKFSALKDLSCDPKLAEALGNMVVIWAFAEEQLIATLARVTNTSLNMAMTGYYRIPTFEARIKFIRALITEWRPDRFDKAEIDRQIDKLSHLAGTRNHWVHSVWLTDDAKTEIILIDPRADIDGAQRSKPVKAADVTNHVEAVRKRAETLNTLLDIGSLAI